MTFRRRLLLACAAAVAAAVALAAVLAYVVVKDTLRGQIDSSLRRAASVMPTDGAVGVASGGDAFTTPAPGPKGGGEAGGDVVMLQALEGPVLFSQVFSGQGVPEDPLPGGPGELVSAADLRALAAGTRKDFFSERDYKGGRLRVYAAHAEGGHAIVVARSLTEVQSVLSTLRVGLAGVILAGVGLALLLGRLATRAAVKPVAHLTETAEHVARTRDLTRRIATGGDDELSRLATSFNTMLEALEHSQRAQRQLVADASHELRTPLTSLRTNLEVLAADGRGLDTLDRERLRADVVGQLGELIALVSDLVDLAREEEPVVEREEVRLDELVAAAVERAARHAPGTRFECELDPTLVTGVSARLDRAVTNLLDNAAKWSPPGAAIAVRLRNGELSVRDHGPGIDPEDLPFVFDRFYRAPGARGRPGSGLGLAIVRQVAEAHGGGVEASEAAGGGALLVLRLPAIPVAFVSASS
jgi:two-component system, OmpR family, sensor histidine kinase MprB